MEATSKRHNKAQSERCGRVLAGLLRKLILGVTAPSSFDGRLVFLPPSRAWHDTLPGSRSCDLPPRQGAPQCETRTPAVNWLQHVPAPT
jgi:hypothetical protein